MKSFKTEKVGISSNEKLSLISNLCTMLTAGIPILETINSLLEDAKGNQKKLLETIRDDLTQGNHLYSSFSKFPSIFNPVTVNIIRASEEAGTLEETLLDLKQNIRLEMEFIDKIKSALVYPLVIFVVFLGVLIMILTVVVPKITTVFISLNVKLPLQTKVLIFLSDIILKQTIPLLSVTAFLALGTFFLYKKQKRLVLSVLFSFPLVSKLIKQIDLVQFSRNLHLLLRSGILITRALELTQNVVMRKDVSKGILHSKEVIISGSKLSEGLKDFKETFPSIMIKIIEAGERSGSLDISMKEITEYLDYEVSKTLKTLTVLIEPIMIVFVGGLIGGLMLSIIAPMYKMIGSIGTM